MRIDTINFFPCSSLDWLQVVWYPGFKNGKYVFLVNPHGDPLGTRGCPNVSTPKFIESKL